MLFLANFIIFGSIISIGQGQTAPKDCVSCYDVEGPFPVELTTDPHNGLLPQKRRGCARVQIGLKAPNHPDPFVANMEFEGGFRATQPADERMVCDRPQPGQTCSCAFVMLQIRSGVNLTAEITKEREALTNSNSPNASRDAPRGRTVSRFIPDVAPYVDGTFRFLADGMGGPNGRKKRQTTTRKPQRPEFGAIIGFQGCLMTNILDQFVGSHCKLDMTADSLQFVGLQRSMSSLGSVLRVLQSRPESENVEIHVASMCLKMEPETSRKTWENVLQTQPFV